MMDSAVLMLTLAVAPPGLMALAAMAARADRQPVVAWRLLQRLSFVALMATLASLAHLLVIHPSAAFPAGPGLVLTLPGAWLAVLVQLLGTVIGAFSVRYLQGEPGQLRFVSGLATVLASVQLLLLADHWLVLIGAWYAVGLALQTLLCFYPERPFAQLVAHKKRIADRLADGFLGAAAALAWWEVGSGSMSVLATHLASGPAGVALQASAVCLVLAVVVRTALLPVHGWLIQVMEAPTPVSALLHAGVINLGAFVLIRFAPLLDAVPLARWLLVVFGLATAVLAGLVMLTRVSIKVRLAWSTVAQMGFMVMECGLGLYTLALLHLIGHSLYKAHTFLASSSVVRQSKLQAMRGAATPSALSLWVAPVAALIIVGGVTTAGVTVMSAGAVGAMWPVWWSGVLAVAWAPLLWLPPVRRETLSLRLWQAAAGVALVTGLAAMTLLAHLMPLGVTDSLHAPGSGAFALAGMAGLYLCQAVLQRWPQALAAWRRRSYAGFYVDEFYTRLALRLSPGGWTLPVAPTPNLPTEAAIQATPGR